MWGPAFPLPIFILYGQCSIQTVATNYYCDTALIAHSYPHGSRMATAAFSGTAGTTKGLQGGNRLSLGKAPSPAMGLFKSAPAILLVKNWDPQCCVLQPDMEDGVWKSKFLPIPSLLAPVPLPYSVLFPPWNISPHPELLPGSGQNLSGVGLSTVWHWVSQICLMSCLQCWALC